MNTRAAWRDLCHHAERFVICVGLAIMTVVTFANVVSRYVFKLSIAFTEELTVNVFVWVSLFGSALAARKGAHLGLSVLTDRMPRHLQAVAVLLSTVLAVALYALVGWYGIDMLRSQLALKQVSPALQIPEWMLSLAVPCGCAVLVLEFLTTGLHEFRKLVTKE